MTQITFATCPECGHVAHDGKMCCQPMGELGKRGTPCQCGAEFGVTDLSFEPIPQIYKAVQITEGNDDLILKFMRETLCPFESTGNYELVIHLDPKVSLTVYPDNWIVLFGKEFIVFTTEEFSRHFRPASGENNYDQVQS